MTNGTSRHRNGKQMKRSWLIQRLREPFRTGHKTAMQAAVNAFAFGGGLKNGGLSDEAMTLLQDVFRFDYMGSSEFEWGAVPEALSRIATDSKKYRAFSLAVPLSDVEPDWRDKSSDEPTGQRTIWVIAHRDHAEEVTERIRGWARERRSDLKEQPRLAQALRPYHEFDTETCGWLELDNGFFFFTDGGMWADTAKLFGVRVQEQAPDADVPATA